MPEPPKYDFDVFISYSSKDKAWVRGELLKGIETAGLHAFIDFRDFARGAPTIKEIERGVVHCRKTLLVLTPNYIDSEWSEYETLILQTLGPANRDLRLLPLLKAQCDLPTRINYLTYIDFTDGADFDLAWQQLLQSLGGRRRSRLIEEPIGNQWFLAHPYPMPPNFTGRTDEREMLSNWLYADPGHPMLVLRALGGFGKSALAWHWLTHDVDPGAWPRVVWWSFYEEPPFESFVSRTLEYLRLRVASQLGPRRQVDALLHTLQLPNILLVLDGFERVLRAFGGINASYQGDEAPASKGRERACLSPLADAFLRGVTTLPGIRGKVLLTTRLRPDAVEVQGGPLLEGCRDEELTQLRRSDAVDFFHAQGIHGARAEIEAACAPYAYHPLSLRLLAGLIVGDLQQPADIVAAKRLDVSGSLVARQHHVLETAYNSLSSARQALLGRIACFRSPVSYDALRALAEAESAGTLDADLRDLVSRGLLHHDTKAARFDLHPIVRRYAYDRLAASDRVAAHTRLRDYFAAVPKPEKVTRLEDIAPVIELYHHTIRAGQFEAGWKVYRGQLNRKLFMEFCVYQTCVELLEGLLSGGIGSLPKLGDADDQGVVLNLLSASYRYLGQPRLAVQVYSPVGDEAELGGLVVNACRFGNIARSQILFGEFGKAQATLEQSVRLCHQVVWKTAPAVEHTMVASFWLSAGLSRLALLFAIKGQFSEAKDYLSKAEGAFDDAEGVFYRRIADAHCALLMRDAEHALQAARHAWNLKDKVGKRGSELSYRRERDEIRADWMVGAALVASAGHGQGRDEPSLAEAELHLNRALECCRRINMVDHEANVLIDLVRLRVATGALDEAQRLAEEALVITQRSGYILHGADAHLELAKLALGRGDRAVALEHAQKARELATCDGPPDYTYKVAYDEAGALLKQLGQG